LFCLQSSEAGRLGHLLHLAGLSPVLAELQQVIRDGVTYMLWVIANQRETG
jgi:hypothetical protein